MMPFIKYVITAVMIFVVLPLFSQTWLELRDKGANYYDIKNAFTQQYGNRMKEFALESRKDGITKSRKTDDFEQQMEGMTAFYRWQHETEVRVMESKGDLGVMAHRFMTAALTAQQNNSGLQTRTGAAWSFVGPKSTATGGGNGRVSSMRALPGSTTTFFACTPAGGLWKTTNGGSSWAAVTESVSVLGASDVAFDPTNANTMYLLTGDGDAGDAKSIGVLKSLDGGATWAATGLQFLPSDQKRFARIIVNPTDGSILTGGSSGIYRSTDKGATWTVVSTLSVRDLKFNTANPQTVYAGGYSANVFLRSTDGGTTWTSGATGLPTSGTQRIAIGVTPLDATYVYALVANNTDYGFKGLYLSTDGGLTFTSKSTAPNILGWNSAGNDAGGQGWYDLTIAVDPANKNIIYTGGVNVWKNTNAGATGSWTCVANWSGSGAPYIHADNHDLNFIGSTLFASNDGGVFCTTNGGTSWTDKSSNLQNAQIYSIGLSSTNAATILTGHQDNGTNLTTDAASWTEVNGGDGMICFIDRTNDNNMYSSIYNGAFYKSTDKGNSFNSFYTVTGGGWVSPWLQDPVNAAVIYAGGTNVNKYNGSSWTAISNFASTVGTLVSVDVAHANNQMIVAASSKTVMLTLDGGTSWNDITIGLPANTGILNVDFDLNNPAKIYAGLASYLGNNFYCSSDAGKTWINKGTGLPKVPVECFASQNNGDLYAGTDLGAYLLSSGTSTWQPFTNGMPGVQVRDLKIFAPTGKLRAATYARGIWECTVNSFNNPPSVAITSPANNATFNAPATVNITASASEVNGTIAKVEFYNGSTLLGTSTASPYAFNWTNVSVGSYTLTAKAYDNLNATTISTAVTIKVLNGNDGGIAIVSPTGSVGTASVIPVVTLTNAGNNSITSAVISSKTDAGTAVVYNWSGSLAAGANTNINLASITGYSLAQHTFAATLGLVNGAVDPNQANNSATSTFIYSTCSNSNEPNDLSTQATVVAVNTITNSQIASPSDIDYYKFTTTIDAPKIKITLTNLPGDYDLYLYSAKSTGVIYRTISSSVNGGTTPESIIYNTPTVGATYYVRVIGYNGAFSTTQCYALGITASASNLQKSEASGAPQENNVIVSNKLVLSPNPAVKQVSLNFTGTDNGFYNVEMFDVAGKQCFKSVSEFIQGENIQNLDISNLSHGLYFVRVSNETNSVTQKLIVE
jgi:hypothetical protein